MSMVSGSSFSVLIFFFFYFLGIIVTSLCFVSYLVINYESHLLGWVNIIAGKLCSKVHFKYFLKFERFIDSMCFCLVKEGEYDMKAVKEAAIMWFFQNPQRKLTLRPATRIEWSPEEEHDRYVAKKEQPSSSSAVVSTPTATVLSEIRKSGVRSCVFFVELFSNTSFS